MEAHVIGAGAVIQTIPISTPEFVIPVILGSGDFFVKTAPGRKPISRFSRFSRFFNLLIFQFSNPLSLAFLE